MTTMAEMPRLSEHAACRHADPDLFISAGDADDEPDYPSAEAVAICHRCPVRAECLTYALEHVTVVGVWGATSSYQRRQLRRRGRLRLRCPSCGGSDHAVVDDVELCLGCGVSWLVASSPDE